MDFEPHNFPALVASVIRSNSALAEPLKEIFAAYGRSEDWVELLERFDGKYHHTLRLIFDDLNDIDDPVSLDQEIQVLLKAIDEALLHTEEDAVAAPRSKAKAGKATRKAGKAKAAAKKKASKPAKKAVKKKAAAPKTKKKSKAAAKKTKPAARKKASKPAKKAVKKKAAAKKAKPAAKKKKTKAKKK